MNDDRIIELYFKRDESAISETADKYGRYCHTVAYNILRDDHESEECVNDTYFRAWSSIPPTVPRILSAFLAKITRNLALDRARAQGAKKRGVAESLEELEGVIGGGELVEELEAREIGEAISEFLRGEREAARKMFVRRYFHGEDVSTIARRYGVSEGRVSTTLFRTRLRLRAYLERMGILI